MEVIRGNFELSAAQIETEKLYTLVRSEEYRPIMKEVRTSILQKIEDFFLSNQDLAFVAFIGLIWIIGHFVSILLARMT